MGVKPLRVRYNKIAAMVQEILDRHSITSPSVPVHNIARTEGLVVKQGDLGAVSGMLVRGSGGATIGVNSKHAPTRRRFTIAHELGHFLLHEGLLSHVDRDFRVNYRDDESSLATNIEEIEANTFAASLLMPEHFLDALNAEDAVDDDVRVANLAAEFAVSQHAMSLRLINLYGRYKPF